jgi:hypothetical protein
LAVADLAEVKLRKVAWDGGRKKGQIGRHTWTVFALPGFFIYPHKETPLKPSFDRAVRQALHAAGYELMDASDAPPRAPILRGEVNACWWWSYTWFWPLVVQGGQNKITLVVESRDRQVLWKREFSRAEPGLPIGGAYGFGLMMKWSMTKLVQDMMKDCSSEEFKKALQTSGGQALAQSGRRVPT